MSPLWSFSWICSILPVLLGELTVVRSDENESNKISFRPPKIPRSAVFYLYFQAPSDLATRVVQSLSSKHGVRGKNAYYDGYWSVEVPTSAPIQGDYALVMKSPGKHHAVAARLFRNVDFKHDQLVVQYEVKFQKPLDCGGAYLKLLSRQRDMDLKGFNDRTPYTIMFGPDKCGTDTKLHFIFQYKNPKTGRFEEKRAKQPSANLARYFSDKRTHLYTLVLNADNSFEIFVDQILVNSGNLLSDIEPPVNPPKEVDDPSDVKPRDWDDREKIPDPHAKKPGNWDESQLEYINDPDAKMPEGWLENEPLLIPASKVQELHADEGFQAPLVENPKCKQAPGCGKWRPPQVKNPLYRGKWSAPLVDNPNYRGVWRPRRIPNPNYFEDHQPYRRLTPIEAIGLELWSTTDEIAFDNFLVALNKSDSYHFAAQTWLIKMQEERKEDSFIEQMLENIQDMARARPWVWTIILSMIGLPFMLLTTGFCSRIGGAAARSVVRKQQKPDPFSLESLAAALSQDAPTSDVTIRDDLSTTSSHQRHKSHNKRSAGKVHKRRK